MTQEEHLQQMKEAEKSFKTRHHQIDTPSPEQAEYFRRLNESQPVINPTTVDDIIKNLNSVHLRPVSRRTQLLPYAVAKEAFILAANRLTGGPEGKFEYNEFNKPVIEQALKWFIADPTCEYDLNRGLCLIGYVGTGKTHLFRIMDYICQATYNPQAQFKQYSCHTISKEISNDVKQLTRYYGHTALFDDLGSEPAEVKIFGNSTAVMADIIFEREKRHERANLITHFTTNIKPQQIEERYGTRVYDRLHKMCNFVFIPQNFSWRKKMKD